MSGIRADRTVIRSSMADLLDTSPPPGASVEATATGSSWGRGAHLQSEPSVRPRYRGPLRGCTDRAPFGWVARWGKFSPAVNRPTQHPRARLRRTGRCRKFSGTVTTTTGLLSGWGVHLWGMRCARTTDTGRRLIAEPAPRGEPDMDRLVALVLHLADCLHAHAPEEVADSTTSTTDHDDHCRNEDLDHCPG